MSKQDSNKAASKDKGYTDAEISSRSSAGTSGQSSGSDRAHVGAPGDTSSKAGHSKSVDSKHRH